MRLSNLRRSPNKSSIGLTVEEVNNIVSSKDNFECAPGFLPFPFIASTFPPIEPKNAAALKTANAFWKFLFLNTKKPLKSNKIC